jgi:murein L,D-transpeptidase YcbB/YkuD
MNITVHERIKTIMVNMERSRWLSHDYTKAKQSIVVNIPSFTLTYFKESKPVLVSRVVGKSMNKTAVFSGQMNKLYLVPIGMFHQVFKKRNITSYRKKSNYLAKHDMEWVGRRVRKARPTKCIG